MTSRITFVLVKLFWDLSVVTFPHASFGWSLDPTDNPIIVALSDKTTEKHVSAHPRFD
jgi:hypothetical protein